jgi:hypothetical protein
VYEAVWIFRFQECKACVSHFEDVRIVAWGGDSCVKETVNLDEDLLPRIALKFSNFLLIS